jgi:hypothetical protein
MDIVMIITTMQHVNGTVEIAATSLILKKKRTNIARIALNVKYLPQIVWKRGLVMAIVMTTITMLNANLILETAATITFLKATNIAMTVLNAKSLHQIVWKNGLAMAIVMITTIDLLVGLMVKIAVTTHNLIRTSIVRSVLNASYQISNV